MELFKEGVKTMEEQQKVLNIFEELNIPYELVNHPPLFTCDDDAKYGLVFNGTVFKNLFVRNKNKSVYYMISLSQEKSVDLKRIAKCLGESKLSFGSEEVLLEKLNTTTGSVSILNIIGSPDTDVVFVIDESALKYEKVGFHPNTNTATLLFNPRYLEKILKMYKADYRFVEIE